MGALQTIIRVLVLVKTLDGYRSIVDLLASSTSVTASIVERLGDPLTGCGQLQVELSC